MGISCVDSMQSSTYLLLYMESTDSKAAVDEEWGQ